MNKYVVLYSLFLGDPDVITGWYRKGYTTSAISMFVFPKGSQKILAGMGTYVRADALGFTDFPVKEGDIIQDSSNMYYQVAARRDWGSPTAFYEVDLETDVSLAQPGTPTPPVVTAHFFGFEVIDVDHEFEDGFERGYWYD